MLLASVVSLAFVTSSFTSRPTPPAVDLAAERAHVDAALRALDAPSVYTLHYGTYEVLRESELGRELEPLLAADASDAFPVERVVQRLRDAAAAAGKPVHEQIEEIGDGALPERARKSGLLFGSAELDAFEVRRGIGRYAHWGPSGPARSGFVRGADVEVAFQWSSSSLDISHRRGAPEPFTLDTLCHPLPVDRKAIDAFVASEWTVEDGASGTRVIRASVDSSTVVRRMVVEGSGPVRPVRFSILGGSADAPLALAVALLWDARGELDAALSVSAQRGRISVVYSRFEGRRSLTSDDECVLEIPRPRRIVDTRDSIPGRAPMERLPESVRSYVRIVE